MKSLLTLGCAASLLSPTVAAQITPMTPDSVASYEETRPDADFVKRAVTIPMRDGVKLYTVIVMK